MKKFFKLMACMLAFVTLFTFTACGESKCSHLYTSTVTKEATCKETGISTHTCDVCGDMYTKEIPMTAHLYTSTVTKEATCKETGIRTHTCDVCGDMYTKEIPMTAHSNEEKWTFNETHHWNNSTCECDLKINYEEHTTDNSGYCITCERPILPTEGVLYDISADGTYAEVIGYEGSSTKINISNTYKGLPVKTIATRAFSSSDKRDYIKSVIIPEGVTYIGELAFYWCSSLNSVSIPSSLKTMETDAFRFCDSISNIYIYDLSSWCKIKGVRGLTYTDTYGGKHKKLYLNNELVDSLILPTDITTIQAYTFEGFSSIRSIFIHKNVTCIENSAFGNCGSLEVVTFDKDSKIESIGGSSFYHCGNLKEIEIPTSVKNIGLLAFSGCDKLQYFEENNAKYLSSNNNQRFALMKVGNISSIQIEIETKIIVEGAFSSCERLTNVYYAGTMEDWLTISIGANSYLEKATIYYYSETEPTINTDNTAYVGNYWHYVNGVATPWVYTKEE